MNPPPSGESTWRSSPLAGQGPDASTPHLRDGRNAGSKNPSWFRGCSRTPPGSVWGAPRSGRDSSWSPTCRHADRGRRGADPRPARQQPALECPAGLDRSRVCSTTGAVTEEMIKAYIEDQGEDDRVFQVWDEAKPVDELDGSSSV